MPDEKLAPPARTLTGLADGPPDSNGFVTFRFPDIVADGLTGAPLIFSEIAFRVGGRLTQLTYRATSPDAEWQTSGNEAMTFTVTDAGGAVLTALHPLFEVRCRESGVTRSTNARLSGTVIQATEATLTYRHGLALC